MKMPNPATFPLLRADPHKWGPGRIHMIDEQNAHTYCGKSLGTLSGTKFSGPQRIVTCKLCIRSNRYPRPGRFVGPPMKPHAVALVLQAVAGGAMWFAALWAVGVIC
jgi:hypothetical protein